ncbi:radical SAM protein [Candidatus Bathyarchaeota archaeon]|nr:radical SAM protein [Candidatus Bathyarchaeota archaeon]
MWRIFNENIFNNIGIKRALPRYLDVLKGNKLPYYVLDRNYLANFSYEMSIEDLWDLHEEILDNYNEIIKENIGMKTDFNFSFLSLKIEIAKRIMESCIFCERRCKINRLESKKGYCGCGNNFSLSNAFPHMGEEPELIPSGTVFTCGCTIRCLHCQNYEISQWYDKGIEINSSQMAKIVLNLKENGCININMVGGEPTPNTYLWLKTMGETSCILPTIWNSNSYYSIETSKLLAGFIDVYLLDFKYGNNDCALKISGAENYFEVCKRNHLMAKEYGELLIRVLVLPGHNECCTRPILEWIVENLGEWTRVNLLFQYRPEWRASEINELKRRLNSNEIAEAIKIAKDVGLKNLV